MTEYNYNSLFNVLAADELDFEGLKRELRPILQAENNADAILKAASTKLDPDDAREMALWAWNYSSEGSKIELAAINIALDTIATIPEDKLETLNWVSEKLVKRGGADTQQWQKAFDVIDTLAAIEQHHAAYAVWRITSKSEEDNLTVLEKALESVSGLAQHERMGCIKWLCQKASPSHALHNEAFKQAVIILDTLPESEQFEEAKWIYDHARKGSRAATQAHKKAFAVIPALSVGAQADATQWVLDNAKKGSIFEKQVISFADKLAKGDKGPQMDFAAFTAKLAL